MFNSIISASITLPVFFICTAAALLLGVLTAGLFMFRDRCTRSFALSLAVLPAIVELVIMMVNGNIGTGVAIAGAFSLVRFRSVRGTAREITGIFFAMALGIACGMGYIAIAGAFFFILALFLLLLNSLRFGFGSEQERELKITIPENLDYDGLFDDLLRKYTADAKLDGVKTTNMGTLYQISYRIRLQDEKISKEFLDEIRQRNGNLNVVCGRISDEDTM